MSSSPRCSTALTVRWSSSATRSAFGSFGSYAEQASWSNDSASGQTLTYSATGLPAGLSISSSGLICGTPTTASTANVSVTAKDSGGSTGSTTFTFTVYGL